MTTSFCQGLLQGVHNFDSHVFKIALYDGDAADLGQSTTAYTATGEISATGYTAGGQALTNLGTSSSGTTGFASFSTVSWTGDGIISAGALIYNSSVGGNPSVCVLSFGIPRYPVSGVFTITFPNNDAQNAIIRVNAV